MCTFVEFKLRVDHSAYSYGVDSFVMHRQIGISDVCVYLLVLLSLGID